MKLFRYLTEAKSDAVAIFIGRMSPPTRAHQGIVDGAQKRYKKVYVVIIEGKKTSQLSKNFLSFEDRKRLLKVTNPGAEIIWADVGFIPAIIEKEKIDTSKGVVIIAGPDRLDGYKRQFSKSPYEVDYVTGFGEYTERVVSATEARKALADKDFNEYKKIIAKGLDNEKYFQFFRKKMKEKGIEVTE